jgi:predicted alpha/beta hydrolase family esterase
MKNPELKKKKQIIMIGGATAWRNQKDFYKYLKNKPLAVNDNFKGWFEWIAWGVDTEYETLVLERPLKENADYEAWKIIFDRYLELLNGEDFILIGGSMGAIFLLKYLSENTLPKKARQVHIVSPMLRNEDVGDDEVLGNFEPDIQKLPDIAEQAEEVFLYHSQDDVICPFSHSEELAQIIPGVKFQAFENRGHFFQSAFPELFYNIPSELYKAFGKK